MHQTLRMHRSRFDTKKLFRIQISLLWFLMHQSSIWHMKDCVERFVCGKREPGRVLEIGSSMGGSEDPGPYKKIFTDLGWRYEGLDLSAGGNVDIIAEDPFIWPMDAEIYDVVISGQSMEHNIMFWLTMLEQARVLKHGGLMIHIAPSRGYEHKAPTDCWRFYRDGMKALASWAGLDCLESTTDWSQNDLAIMERRRPRDYEALQNRAAFANGAWGDTVGVFRKPNNWHPTDAMRYMQAFVDRISI
ncbi:hypothetical protein D3C80_824290 [compost metagenome]